MDRPPRPVSSSAGVSSAAPAVGKGTSAGSGLFIASRTRTKPPLAPGKAPLIMMRPRSPSVATTFRFCMVWRAPPMWPAIFLPLKTLPGSCDWPVEPRLRCFTETPCGRPETLVPMPFHAAGETLADGRAADVDELAGNEVLGAEPRTDVEQRIGADPELGEPALRFHLGLGEMAAHGLAHFLHLGRPETQLHGGVAVLSSVRWATT